VWPTRIAAVAQAQAQLQAQSRISGGWWLSPSLYCMDRFEVVSLQRMLRSAMGEKQWTNNSIVE
jgi:hypothetical protein